MQILGNGIVVFCNKNLCTSEEKINKNTPIIVELSFSFGLKKKKKKCPDQMWLKAFWQMHSLVNSQKKKKIIIILWNKTQDL